MAENKKRDLNEDRILSFLDSVVDTIKLEEDPFELNQYRRLFRKVVPFTMRSYFAAYILKQIDTGKPITKMSFSNKYRRSNRGFQENKKDSKKGRESKANKTRRTKRDGEKSERVVLPEDLSSTLFFSVGRNRRVFPRDIIYLVMQNSGIARDHIGDIRILDSYSFVQVMTSSAEQVIDSLNGINYRGRTLSVSYSKKRESEQEEID